VIISEHRKIQFFIESSFGSLFYSLEFFLFSCFTIRIKEKAKKRLFMSFEVIVSALKFLCRKARRFITLEKVMFFLNRSEEFCFVA